MLHSDGNTPEEIELVQQMANSMLAQLRANQHKGGWTTCEIGWLLARAREELQEVYDAISVAESPDRVLAECADVANMLGMLAQVYSLDVSSNAQ